MHILIYGDAHWSQYSSIIRKQGDRYSVRLENLINSINWVEHLAEENNCEAIINLGDFFDKAELNSEEITALKEVKWNERALHFHLVGNHEMGRNDLSSSSSHLFKLLPNSIVIDTPALFSYDNFDVAFIPYILEDSRKPINQYLPDQIRKRILFTHNDIQGIQMGGFISKAGFTIEEMESVCDLCFNGHLHNGKQVTNKIVNVGNITGQNFGEDALLYKHQCFILDTDTLTYYAKENPYAFNFYKINWNSINKGVILKPNSVCSVKCTVNEVNEVKEWLNKYNAVESRITVQHDIVNVNSIMDIESFSIDHIKKFNEYILNNMENTEILLQELQEISK